MKVRRLGGIAALLLASQAFALGPHEHGVTRLEVTAESGRLTVLMDTPLANLVGFERAPRTDGERQRVDAALTTLNAAATLLKVDPNAACVAGPVTLRAAALEGAGGASDTGHADLDAIFSFKCRKVVPAYIDIGLFAAFPNVQRIDVQLVNGSSTTRHTLARPATRLSITR